MKTDIRYYIIYNGLRTGFNMYIVNIMMNIKYNILLDKTKKKPCVCSAYLSLHITRQKKSSSFLAVILIILFSISDDKMRWHPCPFHTSLC